MQISTPWHKISYDLFLQERLPLLLSERLPLTGYQITLTGEQVCQIQITVQSITATYENIPLPNEDGLFTIQDEPIVVVPIAADDNLETTNIRCVGEQLYNAISTKLGMASPEMTWEIELLKAWLPLDVWINDFFRHQGQRLDTTNWLSKHTHLRRLILETWQDVVTPSQKGRVCPFEMPEGENLGRVFTIAKGASIHDERLILTDHSPVSGLGIAASMIPFLEHNDPNRTLMGANMMRQWIVQENPEPALVQTGFEPSVPGFWNGRNLLTAFIAWGNGTFDDGIVLSESAAKKLDTPYPAEPGDKLSNRFGTKGVVSQVIPDDQMPRMANGKPVELIYNFASLHMRLNFGQILEAVMGRIARSEGQPAIIPPFQAPSSDEIKKRLAAAGLPESGMETLKMGSNQDTLGYPSTVGWVYWGRTVHLAQDKVRIADSNFKGQRQGEMETSALREVGAFENLRELLGIRSTRHPEFNSLEERLARGPVSVDDAPPPIFQELSTRLSAGGISVKLESGSLKFDLSTPQGETLELAKPLYHPWLGEHLIQNVGARHDLPEFALLKAANERAANLLSQNTPERLRQEAAANLEKRLHAYFNALLTPVHLRIGEWLRFSGRGVITPASGLSLDQVGLAEEIAWGLFAPLVIREIGDEEAVRQRSKIAVDALDKIMARTWILVNRAPTITPEAIIAFHPVRDPSHTIRIHPLACKFLNADFDGDQVAVLLPITEESQIEAGERLTIAAHLRRDPGLLKSLLPPLDSLWGLARLSLEDTGRRKLEHRIGTPLPEGMLTSETLRTLLEKVLSSQGVDDTLKILENLTETGFTEAAHSGASLSPFAGQVLPRPKQPQQSSPERWQVYGEEVEQAAAAFTDFANPDLGPQALMVRARAAGLKQLAWLVGSDGIAEDENGKPVTIHGSLVSGLSPEELYAVTLRARRGLAQLAREYTLHNDWSARQQPSSFSVLARARRAAHPGVVFARAAAAGETDPLTDVESRLFVGLPIE